MASPEMLLAVEGLEVTFKSPRGPVVRANAGIDLALAEHETLGIVGESGSGKSVLCRAILHLLPAPPAELRGRVLFEGRDLLALSEPEIRKVRGQDIAMVFQNPMSSLDPVWPIGDQITEGLRVHGGLRGRAATEVAVELLRKVGIASPERRVHDYPHQWSGGMMQRAVIAMAMAGSPRLLLADEPTTALDVTIQDQILSLLLSLQRETGMAMILVSHDMGVIAETCDRVAVMYAGSIVETGPTAAIFGHTAHPYTQALLRSIPSLEHRSGRLPAISGQPPDLTRLPPGCAFADRCPMAAPVCREQAPALREVAPGHAAACHFATAAGLA